MQQTGIRSERYLICYFCLCTILLIPTASIMHASWIKVVTVQQNLYQNGWNKVVNCHCARKCISTKCLSCFSGTYHGVTINSPVILISFKAVVNMTMNLWWGQRSSIGETTLVMANVIILKPRRCKFISLLSWSWITCCNSFCSSNFLLNKILMWIMEHSCSWRERT